MDKEKLSPPLKLPPPPPSSSTSSSTSATTTSSSFIHDLSRMTDNPPKNIRHRRAHSEILTLPDDINFDSDLGVVGGDDTEDDLFSMYIDMDKVNYSGGSSSGVNEGEFGGGGGGGGGLVGELGGGNERVRGRHQHSQSMDGSMNIKPEMLVGGSGGGGGGMGNGEVTPAYAKKAMSASELAELALIDPKRAKRIWANRQSAARSKERKMRYIAELERKVQTLQTEATSLSAQLTLLQRDTNDLASENSELKLRLQTMEQQVHLQDALNEALKEEIQHMKMLTGQAMPNGGLLMNIPASFAASQPFYPSNQAMQTLLTAQQFQQLQIHSQKQQHQFQQHQLHQLQQQQLQQQSHLPVDFKFRSVTQQKDNLSDPKSGSS